MPDVTVDKSLELTNFSVAELMLNSIDHTVDANVAAGRLLV